MPSPVLVSGHAVIDVRGDGNCMYNAVFGCAQSDETMMQSMFGCNVGLREGVQQLREVVAQALRSDIVVQRRLWQLLSLNDGLDEGEDMLKDYPFITENNAGRDFSSRWCSVIDDCATNISTDKLWASEFERHVIEEKLLLPINVQMIVVSALDNRQLLEEYVLEEQTYTALKAATQERCIVLIHMLDHYRYLTLAKKGVVHVTELQEYLLDYVD